MSSFGWGRKLILGNVHFLIYYRKIDCIAEKRGDNYDIDSKTNKDLIKTKREIKEENNAGKKAYEAEIDAKARTGEKWRVEEASLCLA